MEELTKENVLEFWKKATIEQQIENIDRVIKLIDSEQVVDMWKSTKNQVKCQNPNLIIRIIKEKLANGGIYRPGLWKNTPSEVQEQKIEEVLLLYKSKLMIRKIWNETDDTVKELKKEVLAKVLNYDAKLLIEYEIPEYIPVPPGMLGKKEIDEIIWELIQLQLGENTQYNQVEIKSMRIQEMPITLIPYFFEQISKYGTTKDYVKIFWDSLKEDVQYLVIEDVIRKIQSEQLRASIWNELESDMQKRKIKELVKNNNISDARRLIYMTEVQTEREILKEMIEENDGTNIASIWGSFSEEIQLEYFQRVIQLSVKEVKCKIIWQDSAEQVQRNNFLQMIQDKNDDIETIIEIMELAKLPNAEIIGYILEKYEGKVLEEIVARYALDVESLELLRGKITTETKIKIVIRNASELTMEKLEELSESFNITIIQMFDKNLGYWQTQPYSFEQYKRCRTTIDELLEGIDLSQQQGNPNREKIIFGEVIKRLANHISYDYETLEKLDDKTATKEEKNRCANMTGGLLNKTCVCSGYAEIVRNVFACCGIEARYVSGSNIVPGESGHAWNQIKLDGTWYNMDLTWDRDRIVAGEMPLYLLKSDGKFIGHDEYNTKFCEMEECRESVHNNEMQWYIYKILEIPKTLDTSVRRVRRGRVKRAYDMIAASQEKEGTKPEKREEQWTN